MGKGRLERGETTAAYAKRWAYSPSCACCGKKFAGYIFLFEHLSTKHK